MKALFLKVSLITLSLLSMYSCTDTNPFEKDQQWTGSYICTLEKYDISINITEVQGNIVKGVVNEQLEAYKGSFNILGEYHAKTKKIEFKAMDWISSQKPRFRNAKMVDFSGFVLSDPFRFEGEIKSDEEKCFGFNLVLQN